jgi:type IV pilus assembly protein PilF
MVGTTQLKKIFLIIMLFNLSACNSMTFTSDAQTAKLKHVAEINTQLGMAYLQRHEMQRAKQKLLIALEEDPKLPEAWYSMGYYMEITGDLDNAKKYYLKSVQLAPKHGDVQNNYGTFLCRRGEYNEAIKHFMLAVADTDYLETASAYENAGLCALKIPDKKLALNYFNRTLMLDPNHPNALLEAAELNFQNKNFSDAKIQLAEYLAIATPNAQSQMLSHNLGRIDVPFPSMIS